MLLLFLCFMIKVINTKCYLFFIFVCNCIMEDIITRTNDLVNILLPVRDSYKENVVVEHITTYGEGIKLAESLTKAATVGVLSKVMHNFGGNFMELKYISELKGQDDSIEKYADGVNDIVEFLKSDTVMYSLYMFFTYFN